MITSSGPMCDVCGHYILPLGDELVNFFSVKGIKDDLCCDNKCKSVVLDAAEKNNWKLLPDGPLKKAFAEAMEARDAKNDG